MTRPTRRALLILGGGLPLSLVPAIVRDSLWPVWAVYLLLLLLAVGADLLLAPRPSTLRLEVAAPPLLRVGRSSELTIGLTLPGAGTALLLCDLDPLIAAVAPLRVSLEGGNGSAQVPLQPLRRGPARLGAVWVRWWGPLGLVALEARREVDLPLPITPDVTGVQEVALRFVGSPLVQAGLKVERVRGEGSEFESLREFVAGMDTRAIDWKASARHRKLLAREHRAERNHQVIVAVDSGHLMAAPLGRLARLDHAVHAALVLSWVGLRTGDRVGVYGFDSTVRCWTDPQGGSKAWPRVQKAFASLLYSDAETNFTLGLAELSARTRRRSLLVLFTDFSDSIGAELMLENVERLRARHLVLFVALRDPGLDRQAAAIPEDLSELHRAVIAADLRRERELVLLRLRRMGVHTLDVTPAQAAPELVARYLEVKRRELV